MALLTCVQFVAVPSCFTLLLTVKRYFLPTCLVRSDSDFAVSCLPSMRLHTLMKSDFTPLLSGVSQIAVLLLCSPSVISHLNTIFAHLRLPSPVIASASCSGRYSASKNTPT